MRNLKLNLAYWIPTLLVSLNWAFGGISSLLKAESSLEVYRRLGYPEYFSGILGIAQLLGVAAILAPVPRTLREWAYAGFTFDVTFAMLSFWAIGTPQHAVFPMAALPLVLGSYWMWKGRLKAAGT